jgi:hypothetical protein
MEGEHADSCDHVQAGGRKHGAKQKAFVTVLARAPSLAFLLGGQKTPGSYGGSFCRPKPERGAEEVGMGGIPIRPSRTPKLNLE